MCGEALPYRLGHQESKGAAPQFLGVAPISFPATSGRSETFRTSDGIAANYLTPSLTVGLLPHISFHLQLSQKQINNLTRLTARAFQNLRRLQSFR
jgi:hypothetical protein